MPIYIKHKLEEKQRLEEQIQQAGALLQSKNVDIETINEFNQLKEELNNIIGPMTLNSTNDQADRIRSQKIVADSLYQIR